VKTTVLAAVGISYLAAASAPAADRPEWATMDIRAGIIGTDTSHVPAFTAGFHKHPEWRIRVVAAYKGGSPDLPISANRVEKFAAEIRDKHDVEIVDSIEALLARVDVVLLESVDGRPHLGQARPVLKAGKQLFIDKPLAANLADAREIARLSKETGTPFFTCSCSRFVDQVQAMKTRGDLGTIQKAQGSSPLNALKGHPDLYFYGIHGIEALYAVMGPGCMRVSRKVEGNMDITTGTWHNGRVGVYRGVKKGDYKPILKVWGEKGEAETSCGFSYDGLLEEMARFFQTGRAPIDPAETLEIFTFMSAAQLSLERGGKEVELREVISDQCDARTDDDDGGR
jgi:hypothetical protein